MNAWSVLAGLLVTVGGAGAGVLLHPLEGSPLTGSAPQDGGGPLGLGDPLGLGGGSGNSTGGNGAGGNSTSGNGTSPPSGNSSAPPPSSTTAPPANATAATNGTCSCVHIEEWNDGVGPASGRWSFPVVASNTFLTFHLDVGSGIGVDDGVSARLLDGNGNVVAQVERSGLELLTSYATMDGTLKDPSAGTWTLEVKVNGVGLLGSYDVSVETGC